MSQQEIEAKKAELRESVNKWKAINPEWENAKSLEIVKPHITESTFITLRSILPVFCSFVDKLPDQIIEERLTQIRSDNVEERLYFENRFAEFRNYLQEHHLTGNSVKNYLGKVAGWFRNNGAGLRLPTNFWKRAKRGSELRESFTENTRLIDNSEIRLIVDISDNTGALGFLLSAQNGMLPADIVNLTYENFGINLDEDQNDFSWFKYRRQKTYEEHFIVVNPDIRYFLKQVWVESERPQGGYIFRGHEGSNLHAGSLSNKFKEYALKALGDKRGSEITFKNLRDYYNTVLLKADLPDQYKKTLFGHKPSGEEGSYEYSEADLLLKYQEKVFPLCSVNGFDQKVRTSQIEGLSKKIKHLEEALTRSDLENSTFRTRFENLQESIPKLIDQALVKTFQTLAEKGNLTIDVDGKPIKIKELKTKS